MRAGVPEKAVDVVGGRRFPAAFSIEESIEMPGIMGIITSNPSARYSLDLQRMMDCMLHESGYGHGRYINEDAGVYLGWTCHKGSSLDCMPIWNETRDVCLIFSGEEFPDAATLNYLKSGGHAFNTADASYLIHLFEEKGDGFFKTLNGFFHGVIVDLRRGEVVLFNDRYGMQRVYYREEDGVVRFSSEAKSLLKTCPESRQINPSALGQLLSMGCVLENSSLFKDIGILQGGSLWRFHKGHCGKKERYFQSREWEDQSPLTRHEFYDRLRETFTEILPKYFHDARPVGMSLTGGLDTRIIMAYAERSPYTLPCYTFGSTYRDSFDVRVARKVAETCKQTHSTIKVGEEFLSDFARYSEKAVYISDGYIDSPSGAAELYINRKAAEIAPVRMTGCFGSEVLRSIRGFRFKAPDNNLFNDDFSTHIQRAHDVYERNIVGHPLSLAVFTEAPFFNYNRVSVEQSQITKRTPFMDNKLVALVYRAPREAAINDQISFQLVRDGNRQLSRIVTNRGAGGNRYPLLSEAVQRYYGILGRAEIGYDYGMPQWASSIDYFLRPLHLEKLFLGWNSFYHFRIWFRKELSGYIKQILLDRKTMSRPYWNGKFLEKMVIGHLRGTRNYTNEITKVLSLELTHRVLLER